MHNVDHPLRLYSYFLFLFKPTCCAEPVLVLAALDDLVDRVLIVSAVVELEPNLLVGRMGRVLRRRVRALSTGVFSTTGGTCDLLEWNLDKIIDKKP